MKHPMYCQKCGTYFWCEPGFGRRTKNFECPTCEATLCVALSVNSDKGVAILSHVTGEGAYPEATEYRFNNGTARGREKHGVRGWCEECNQ